jgi:O-antigen ligase
MTAGRAAPEAPHPLAITMMAAVAGLVPLIVFGDSTALLVAAVAALAATLWAVIRHPRSGWLLAVACLPITTAVPIATTGAMISIPLEVVAGILAPLLLFALLQNPRPIRGLLLHPLSIAVGLQLAWMAAATVFSSDPIVSTKALAVRVVHLAVFYIGGFLFLDRTLPGRSRDPVRTTATAVLFFAVPTTLWALLRHAPFGFARRESYEIAQPFFSNHTEYATTLVVWLCLAACLRQTATVGLRRFLTPMLILLGSAVLAAGARSAWVALLAAIVTLVALRFRLDPLTTKLVGVVIVLTAGAAILGISGLHIDRNPGSEERVVETPAAGRLLAPKMVEDESILERLNRWHCALRMLRDRPLFGFGPATYESNYGGYQQHQQLTRVSTFMGDRGGAHSEYMTVAAEHGFGGILSLLAVVVFGLRSGGRAYRSAATALDKGWAAAWTAAFAALAVSSCFNSLLELDKTAPLFWLTAAVLVYLDLESDGSGECRSKDVQGLFSRPVPTEGS